MAKSKHVVSADKFISVLGKLFVVGGDGSITPYDGIATITADEIKSAKGAMPYQALASGYPGPDPGVFRACENLLKQGWTGTQPFGFDVSRLLLQWLAKNDVPILLSMREGEQQMIVLSDKKSVARILK